jgi:recombination protein RecA
MAKGRKKKDKEIDISEDLKVTLECDEIEDVEEFISTGSTLLDYIIANKKDGGIPVGRITELYGENQAGKTLIGTHILAETQKKDGIAICIDTEHDMQKDFAYRIGLNWDKLIYKEYLNSLEEVFAYIEKVIKVTRLKYKDRLVTILWDSIAATPAGAELESGYDPTKFVGLHARIMSAGIRKIRPMIKSERIALVCTNQLRTKIGVSFGDPNITAHGRAMSFYASLRISLKRVGQLKDSNRTVGAHTEAKVVKSKLGPAYRTARFPIMYDYGVDNIKSIKDYLFDLGIIEGAAWKTIEIPNQIEPIKFQQDKDWYKLYKENKELRDYVNSVIEENMIIKFIKLEDLDIDVDSILEVEQIKASMDGKE